MAVPWLRILDAALGIHDLVRVRRGRGLTDAEESRDLMAGGSALGGLETRLAGVVVAALKEAFDRDSRRLEHEREQLAAERRRAERVLQLELLRQSGDREIGRLRLVAGLAAGTFVGTLFFAGRVLSAGGPVAARVLLGLGWLALLIAMAVSFGAQSAIAREMQRAGTNPDDMPTPAALPTSGAVAPLSIVIGLALIAVAVLLS
ncbi:MAG TPA: hypothetical protein VH583_21330 [Vicinamibacterales bacterium]|jgi:hypothetical protein